MDNNHISSQANDATSAAGAHTAWPKRTPTPVTIYVDGSSYFAGTRRECGAVGVHVACDTLQHLSFGKCICKRKGQVITNQAMQLEALKQGLMLVACLARDTGEEEQASDADAVPCEGRALSSAPTTSKWAAFECVTGSAYVMKFLHRWCPIWERTGWVTKNKQPVKNATVLSELLALYQSMPGVGVRHWEAAADAPCGSADRPGHGRACELAAAAAYEGSRIGCHISRGMHISSLELLGF